MLNPFKKEKTPEEELAEKLSAISDLKLIGAKMFAERNGVNVYVCMNKNCPEEGYDTYIVVSQERNLKAVNLTMLGAARVSYLIEALDINLNNNPPSYYKDAFKLFEFDSIIKNKGVRVDTELSKAISMIKYLCPVGKL